MQVVDLALDCLKEASWNPNVVDEVTLSRLRESIRRYGLVEPLVVRHNADKSYEVLSGNHRLRLLRGMGLLAAPCVVVDLDDAQARLLAQALNHIRGEDDLGLRADLLNKVLESVPETEVMAILPETAGSLRALASMGKDTMADHLQNWQQAQSARLRHLQFQVTADQLRAIEAALAKILPEARKHQGGSPNLRGTALYLLCQRYVEREKDNGS